MEVFLARQPIFDADKKTFGYELLFRIGLENIFPEVDGDAATSNLLSNIFFPFDFKEILGKKPGLINFTENLILDKIPLLLPKEHFIVEVLEDIEPGKEVVSALAQLRDQGFSLALDDFVYHEKFHPMMELCKIIKFDVRATPLDSLGGIVKKIQSRFNLLLLAEKVETYTEFEQAKEMGFALFQGYFFSRPEVLSTKGISTGQLTKIRLINEISQKDINLKVIAALIKNDAAISFKLLKYINSAYFTRLYPIDTIKDALAFLGTDELRKFVNIVVISVLCSKKPDELVRASIIRARMCENCSKVLNTRFTGDELFTLGLFSFMDAVLDCKMEEILTHIAFSPKMKQALMGNDKEFNIILNIVKSFEIGNWTNKIFSALSGKSIELKLPGFYLESIKMANSLF
jgi:EAL and modified HD-GYP domain-containing signal transduction protein